MKITLRKNSMQLKKSRTTKGSILSERFILHYNRTKNEENKIKIGAILSGLKEHGYTLLYDQHVFDEIVEETEKKKNDYRYKETIKDFKQASIYGISRVNDYANETKFNLPEFTDNLEVLQKNLNLIEKVEKGDIPDEAKRNAINRCGEIIDNTLFKMSDEMGKIIKGIDSMKPQEIDNLLSENGERYTNEERTLLRRRKSGIL